MYQYPLWLETHSYFFIHLLQIQSIYSNSKIKDMGNFVIVFWVFFVVLLIIIVLCDLKYNMLRDDSAADSKPYSWSRVQLAWWTLIIISAFVTIICCYPGHEIPTLDSSALILLGISTATTATSRIIDMSDKKNAGVLAMIQDQPSENFFLDILSDGNGVSISRLQTVIFNLVFGVWFISYVLLHFLNPCAALHPAIATCSNEPWNYIMPIVSPNNLVLLAISSGTYAFMKSSENPQAPAAATIQATKATNIQTANERTDL